VAPPAAPLSPIRALGWAALFIGGGFFLMVALAVAAAAVTGGLGSGTSPKLLLIQTVCGLAAFGLLTWLIGIRLLRLTLADLRWAPGSQALPGLAGGLVLGAAPAALAVGLSLVAGGASFLPDDGGVGAYLRQVGLTALMLAPAAFLEEIMFRGVGQVVLARPLGRMRAVVLLSVVFALAHLFNPNSTPLGLFNIALAGVFLGVAFYLPGGIWTAWGAHLGWNATLAALDAPVSGLPFEIPLIDYAPGGPQWLTGGSFGPEGGLLATATLGLGIALAWRWMGKEQAS
jgi:hypothetical protein